MPNYAVDLRARVGRLTGTARVTGRHVPVYRNDCVIDLPAAAGVVAVSVSPAILEADKRGEGK